MASGKQEKRTENRPGRKNDSSHLDLLFKFGIQTKIAGFIDKREDELF
jgi:hypothetical protein